jgi:hypothetical protein
MGYHNVVRYKGRTAGHFSRQGVVTLSAAKQAVVAGQGHLLNLDECDLHLLPAISAIGMKGPSRHVSAPGVDARKRDFNL